METKEGKRGFILYDEDLDVLESFEPEAVKEIITGIIGFYKGENPVFTNNVAQSFFKSLLRRTSPYWE
jgi:hypothetical protein